ncbi:hypothetical protein [Kitasatospora sp. NPDC001175]|uniref:hypothetical protein n=1 Tax=Kitasatospora sp. NPDC001175 TaxID=3157103 RepID=UPI003D04BE36
MTVVIQTKDPATAPDDEPLLSYQITTTPSPLKASPENPQAPEEIGEVVISVSRQSGTPADVEWIRVKVPAGTMSPDLATDLNKISPRISLTDWTVRLDSAAKEFVCAPTASHAPIGPDTGFTIQLSDIPINRKVGTAPVTVTESSRTGNAAFKDRATIFHLGKFPADFYLRNFQCEPSIIPNGGDVLLTWERSANATYELLYLGFDRDVTNRTSLPIEGIKSDTTFYLRATTGDASNPVVRILSTHLTVIKPDLDIGSITVNDTLNAGGSVDFSGAQVNAAGSSVDFSRAQVNLFGYDRGIDSGTVYFPNKWRYEFRCDGFFILNFQVNATCSVQKPTGPGEWSTLFSPAEKIPHFVRKGWRLEVGVPNNLGRANGDFYPFGTWL